MKWIFPSLAALVLASTASVAPVPLVSTDAFADRMNGKATCGQMTCSQDRYYAAKRKEAKQKKTN